MIPQLPLLLLACAPDKPAGDGGSTVDCPTPSTWYVDEDGDGYGAGEPAGQGCVRPDGHAANAEDCDDTDDQVHPGGDEVCDGFDNDCDSVVDPSTAVGVVTCWIDEDGDGFGAPGAEVTACACTDELADNDQDCDDDDPDAWPGAAETLYDGMDSDCLGLQGEYDQDGDGHDWIGGKGLEGTDCDDSDPLINPEVLDLCDDEIDQDCDGVLQECGLGKVTDAGEAWWQVYRDSDIRTAGYFGRFLQHAGDSDNDGRPEILAPVVAQRCSDSSDPSCWNDYTYALMEAPSWTSGGQTELSGAAMAAWAVDDDADVYWTSVALDSDHQALADVDFDGDGIHDYLLGADGEWMDETLRLSSGPSRIDLWLGPPPSGTSVDEPQDLLDAQTVIVENDVILSGGVELLVPPVAGNDWVIAAGMSAADDTLEGTVVPAAVLLRAAHFNGDESWDDAPRLWVEAPYAAGAQIEVGDVNGDGLRDLALSSAHYTHPLPPGRIWIAPGPVDADLDLADATWIIDGDQESDFFGTTFSIVADMDGDGRDEIVANQRYLDWEPDYASVHIYNLPSTSAGGVLDFGDSIATLQSVSTDDEEAYSNRFYAPRLAGDVDGDGANELAVTGLIRTDGGWGETEGCVLLFDTPLAGVRSVTDHDGLILSDPDSSGATGFGSSVLGGVDYDGDTWPDLVVGEYYWNSNPEDSTPYGRINVFRGPVGR